MRGVGLIRCTSVQEGGVHGVAARVPRSSAGQGMSWQTGINPALITGQRRGFQSDGVSWRRQHSRDLRC